MVLSKDQRRALKLLLDTAPQGCDKSMLLAWGLKVEMLSRLVCDGLADIQPRTMRAGGRSVTVVPLTITDAGRRAGADHHIAGCRARATTSAAPVLASPPGSHLDEAIAPSAP
jgi:hypothetical protein